MYSSQNFCIDHRVFIVVAFGDTSGRSKMFGAELFGAFDNEYDTALGMAKKYGKNHRIVDLLMRLGAPDQNY
jgi:hypothetical protein